MNIINDELPKLLQQWQLSNVRAFTHLAMTNNYVIVAYSDLYQKDVVLKVGPKKVIDAESLALQYFQGEACVKVLAFDTQLSDTHSALLLERVQPGNSLKELFLKRKPEEAESEDMGEQKSIEIFANLVKKLHSKPKKYDSKNFRTAEQRMHLLYTFQSKNERLMQLLPRAIKVADQLVATSSYVSSCAKATADKKTTADKQYLLHGDLHHENILQRKPDEAESEDRKGSSWVMIDPQGIVAELEYEVGAFIRNPLFELLDQPNLENLLLYRFERLSQLLNLDKQRMIDWTFVQTVLSACFTEQDGKQEKGQNYFLTIAELIAKITHPDYKLEISTSLVQKLIAEQFPQWADLSIRPVAVSGWDNKTFHLGDAMSVRLPSGQEYAAQVAKEQKWLPILAQHISIPISEPIAMGKASQDYPFDWSIYRWIEGKSANTLQSDELDFKTIATQLAQFLNELHKIDTQDGPVTDRGGSPIVYDNEARSSIIKLENLIDVQTATAVWDAAIDSHWQHAPMWSHGDLSSGNILIKDKQLCAVIDFGGMTIGDPACDLVIAWTFLDSESRQIFKNSVNLDEQTWARARGWALWKAMITLVAMEDKLSLQAHEQLRIINEILDEHKKL